MSSPEIAPSILSADFTVLGDQVQQALDSGIRYIHFDVMDGAFVPNLSIGVPVLKALKPLADQTGAILDVHLMIEKPERLIPAFAKAGADILTVHVETCPHLHRVIQQIRELGVKPGVALNPATSLHTLETILPDIDLALIMSVNPGFGGQSYIPASTERIAQLRKMLDAIGSTADLEVDGGIKPNNIRTVADAGANVLVAGSAVFNQTDSISNNISALKSALTT